MDSKPLVPRHESCVARIYKMMSSVGFHIAEGPMHNSLLATERQMPWRVDSLFTIVSKIVELSHLVFQAAGTGLTVYRCYLSGCDYGPGAAGARS